MKIFRAILLTLLLVVVLIAVGGFAFFWDTTRGPLPAQDGSITVSGLDGQAEILRDSLGIANIYASSLNDLYFAQGYAQAQDRWWQMEFYRNIGRGSVERLVGRSDALLATDVFIRSAGWYRAAERDYASASPLVRSVLDAFTAGVNAYITSRPLEHLAMEYRILGLTGVSIALEPWSPVDSLVFGKVLAWDLSGYPGDEIERAQMAEVLSPEMMGHFFPAWPYGSAPTVVTPEDLDAMGMQASTMQGDARAKTAASEPAPTPGYPPAPGSQLAGGVLAGETVLAPFGFQGGGAREGIGSNNWVVSGDRTNDGLPMLANDTHLSFGIPGIWYQVGLYCQPVTEACPMQVSGFTFAAVPGVIIGHNADIAWGVTSAGPDVLDLYRIEVNPENPLQYRWEDGWRDMTVHQETIVFGDGEPSLTLSVRETHLGPIINDNRRNDDGSLSGFNNEDPLAMRWIGNESGTLVEGIIRLNRARDWEGFRDALSYWDVAAQNFVYADREGNIGYQLPGRFPVRPAAHTGFMPADGTTAADEWLGFIPYDSLPRIFNPARGYIASANQAIVPPEYFEQLDAVLSDEYGQPVRTDFGIGFANGNRALRITSEIERYGMHSFDTFRAMHADNISIDALGILPYYESVYLDDDQRLADYRGFMYFWNKEMRASSGEAVLWAYTARQLLHNTFDDQLPDGITASRYNLYALRLLMDDPENAWWDDAATTDRVETRDEIMRRSLVEAIEAAEARFGPDRMTWQWGDAHQLVFVNQPLGLSGVSVIEGLVNRGPFGLAGSNDTVNASSFDMPRDADANAADGIPFPVTSGVSMRLIVQMHDLGRTYQVITTGQSGHPFSENYSTMIDLWRDVNYHSMPWTRGSVEAANEHRLLLNPAG
jgi:penicillin amidase